MGWGETERVKGEQGAGQAGGPTCAQNAVTLRGATAGARASQCG